MIDEVDGARAVLAPAKLTTNLRVVGRRSDGYHLIESEMTSVSLFDEILLWPKAPAEKASLSILDPLGLGRYGFEMDKIPRGPTNLICRALELTGVRAGVEVVKRIPPGAGLGGGSSDAAAVIRNIRNDCDAEAILSLGADVPFCVQVGRAAVSGIGEIVNPIEASGARYILFLVPVHSPTSAVYRALDEMVGRDVGLSGDRTSFNDLEQAALAVSPRLRTYRDFLASILGRAPQMAGSGSSFFVQGDFADFGLDSEGSSDGVQKTVLSDGTLSVIAVQVYEVSKQDL